MKKIALALSCLFLFACQEDNLVLRHFPSQSIFKEGFANKYYNHFKPYDRNLEAKTRISYATYQLLEDGQLKIENYNAGFELSSYQYFHIEKTTLHLDSAWYIAGEDTLRVEIEAGATKNFLPSESCFYKENYFYQDAQHQYISHQFESKDSLVDGKSARLFLFNRSYRNLDLDSTLQSWQAKELYLENLGFFYGWEQGDEGIFETELVEQMPLTAFKESAQHGKMRVAYIDPKESLGSAPNFKLCGSENNIADYYNGEPDGGFRLGNKVLLNHLKASLSDSAFAHFEGMLSLRFVISCEDKLGRFIAEAYDFNYQKQALPEQVVPEIIQILIDQNAWQATEIRGEKRDSYAYLTLKIKDATIIDLLP